MEEKISIIEIGLNKLLNNMPYKSNRNHKIKINNLNKFQKINLKNLKNHKRI